MGKDSIICLICPSVRTSFHLPIHSSVQRSRRLWNRLRINSTVYLDVIVSTPIKEFNISSTIESTSTVPPILWVVIWNQIRVRSLYLINNYIFKKTIKFSRRRNDISFIITYRRLTRFFCLPHHFWQILSDASSKSKMTKEENLTKSIPCLNNLVFVYALNRKIVADNVSVSSSPLPHFFLF